MVAHIGIAIDITGSQLVGGGTIRVASYVAYWSLLFLHGLVGVMSHPKFLALLSSEIDLSIWMHTNE